MRAALTALELNWTFRYYWWLLLTPQLMQADEVFITNSILGVAPVTRISETQFDIGTVTRSLFC